MAQIPTPDLAVPYAAPKQVKTMAEVHPIAPKNGYIMSQHDDFDLIKVESRPECFEDGNGGGSSMNLGN
jgi:hypothetical protein